MAFQDGPWSKYQTTPAPTSAPRQSAPPAYIPGPAKTVDPAEAERLRLAQAANARAEQDQNRGTIPAGYERKPDGSIAPMAGYDPNKSGKPNEGEMKASSFLTRALGANTSFEGSGATEPRSLVGQSLQDYAPGINNTLFNSPERQVSDSAQNEFIAATLRQDSGAAIPPAELEAQRRLYFPMPGDTEQVLAQKRAARFRAIAGLERSAGSALDEGQKKLIGQYRELIDKAVAGQPLPAIGAAAERPMEGFSIEGYIDRKTGLKPTDWSINDDGSVRLSYEGGRTEDITPPADFRNSAQYRDQYIRKFGEEPPLAVDVGAPGATQAAPSAIEAQRKDQILDPFVRGAADVATLGFADEIAAAGDTLFGGGTYADNLRNQRGIDAADARVNPWPRGLGQVAGALVPISRLGGVGRGAALAPRGALSYAKEGGLIGAGYGAGSANPDADATLGQALGQRAGGAVVGGAIGGATGYGIGALANRFTRGGPPTPPGGQDAVDIARAGAAEAVPLSRPIVDPSRRNAMAYLESSIGGGNTVRKALEGTSDAIESRASQLGAGGTAQDEFAIGSAVQKAGRDYIKRSGGVATRMYDRAAQIAGDAKVLPTQAVKKLDDEIATLSANPNQNAAEISFLQKYRADLVDDAGNPIPKTVQELRDMRTNLRGVVGQSNLTATKAEGRVIGALDAAKADIQRDLSATNPAAVRAYDRADKFYRERQGEIKGVVQRVLGRSRNQAEQISPERAWQNIKTMAGPRGDSDALARMWAKLDPEAQRDGAATLAENFGRRASDEPFSPDRFITATNGLSKAARETIFGPEGAQSISNLRKLSRAYSQTAKALNNSRSGVVINWGNELKSLVTKGGAGAVIGGAIGGPAGAAVGGALGTGSGQLAKYLTARALMSPDMSRWLANAPRQTTPRAIANYVSNGLATVARRDPAIAQDALGLQRYLQQALAQSPMKAAADEKKQ